MEVEAARDRAMAVEFAAVLSGLSGWRARDFPGEGISGELAERFFVVRLMGCEAREPFVARESSPAFLLEGKEALAVATLRGRGEALFRAARAHATPTAMEKSMLTLSIRHFMVLFGLWITGAIVCVQTVTQRVICVCANNQCGFGDACGNRGIINNVA